MPGVPCVRPSHGSVQKPANGMAAQRAQLLRRGLHEQADLPVAGVIAERDRRAVRRADAALRAEDEELRAAELARVPAHAGVLRQPEEVAAGALEQHLLGQRQLALRGRRPRSGSPRRTGRIGRSRRSRSRRSSVSGSYRSPARDLPILVLKTPCFGLLFHAWLRRSIDNSMTSSTRTPGTVVAPSRRHVEATGAPPAGPDR